MSNERKVSDWVSTSDAAFSWGERIAKWIIWAIGSGSLVTVAGAAFGFFSGNPMTGLVIGVLLGALVMAGLALKGLQLAVSGSPDASQTKLSPKEMYTEIQHLTGRVKELEEENERLRGSGDEDLKGRCSKLSDDLFAFVRERDTTDPEKSGKIDLIHFEDPNYWENSQIQGKYNEETIALYREKFEPETRAVVSEAERRGWLTSEDRQGVNVGLEGMWSTPTEKIKTLAPFIAALGKRG